MNKTPNLGSINAATVAHMYDIKGNLLGYCMDTPNNAAYAMAVNDKIETVKTPFNGIWKREQLNSRFAEAMSIKNYHSKYVKFL